MDFRYLEAEILQLALIYSAALLAVGFAGGVLFRWLLAGWL